MALYDLSRVTRACTELIGRHIEASSAWFPRARPDVSPMPPDQLSARGLSFYLYHMRESAYHRNVAPPDPASDHNRFLPMPLSLYYQLSAIPGDATAQAHLDAQLLFGCALKALHDVPELTDKTEINGIAVLAQVGLEGAQNRFRLQMLSMTPQEAVTYWTDESRALRLAAYYEVNVVFLEPQAAERRSGRVSSYTVATNIAGAPIVRGTSSVVTFTQPDGSPASIETSPASVAYGAVFRVQGSHFTGQSVELTLRGNQDPEPRVVGADWGVSSQSEEVSAVVASTAGGTPLLPGVYALAVRVSRLMAGRLITLTSNTSPIQIAPAITQITTTSGQGFRITGSVFSAPGLDPATVELQVGESRLVRVNAAPGPGEFRIVTPTRVDLTLPQGLMTGAALALRLHVRGIESPPNWVVVP
jgi:hypothetical protein